MILFYICQILHIFYTYILYNPITSLTRYYNIYYIIQPPKCITTYQYLMPTLILVMIYIHTKIYLIF
jgi:hypothetical protein